MNNEIPTSWYLYNALTEARANAMSLEASLEVISKLKLNELEYWFAWHKGWADWKSIESVPEFQEEINKIKIESAMPPPPPPPPKPALPEIQKLPVKASRVKTHSHGADPFYTEKRTHKRYSIELKVIFKKGDQIFRTFTKNISLGGLALKNPLPEAFTTGECEIFISSPEWNENIKFTARIAENITHRSRIQFLESKEFFSDKLAQWLEELDYQTQSITKKAA